MKRLIIFLLVSLNCIAADIDYNGTKNPMCSASGLRVLFLNGVSNSYRQASDSKDFLRTVVRKNSQDLREKILDENKVQYGVLYNPTYSILVDGPEYLIQKSREAGALNPELEVIRDEIVDFDPKNIPTELSGSEKALLRSSYSKSAKYALQRYYRAKEKEPADLSVTASLAVELKKYVDSNEKILIVAHSQGNMFANEIYLTLKSAYSGLAEKLDNYLGVVYVASPADYLTIPHNEFMKLKSDHATGGKGLGGNLTALGEISGNDWFNHGFVETYLNDSIQVVTPSGEMSSLREVFLNNVAKVARSFPPNCCRSQGSTNEIPIRTSSGSLIEGYIWVADTASLDITNATISSGVEICDNAEVSGDSIALQSKVRIRGNTKISGNNNSFYTANYQKTEISDFGDLFIEPDGEIFLQGNTQIAGDYLRFENEASDETMPLMIEDASIEGCYGSFDTSKPEKIYSTNYITPTLIKGGVKIFGHVMVTNSIISGPINLKGEKEAVSDCVADGENSRKNFTEVTGSVLTAVLNNTREINRSRVLSSKLTSINANYSYIDHVVLQDLNMDHNDCREGWEQQLNSSCYVSDSNFDPWFDFP